MNYFVYLLKSKGRHGTHSPFIYKMVEEALHESGNWDYPSGLPLFGAKRKLAKTLFRILHYLQKTKVLVDRQTFAAHEWIARLVQTNTVDFSENISSNATIISSASQFEFFIGTQADTAFENATVIVLHPGNSDDKLVQSFFESDLFNCTIFTWDFSILLNNKNFKRKQHFVLR